MFFGAKDVIPVSRKLYRLHIKAFGFTEKSLWHLRCRQQARE